MQYGSQHPTEFMEKSPTASLGPTALPNLTLNSHEIYYFPINKYVPFFSIEIMLCMFKQKPKTIARTCSKLVADRFEAKFRYAIWFEAGSN